MSRFTKKSTKFANSYEWNRKLPTKTFVQLGMNELGKIEDILEKFGIDDLETLEEILKVHKHLLDHDYSTLPKEDFDLLFEKVKAFEILCEYDLKKSDITKFATYKDFIKDCYLDINGKISDKCPTEEKYDLLKKVLLCGL